jgi:hypothetical protein
MNSARSRSRVIGVRRSWLIVVEQAQQAGAHPVEGAGERQHLLRAALGQGRRFLRRAEGFRRRGEPGERRGERPRRPEREQREADAQEDEGEDDRSLRRRPGKIVGQHRPQPGAGRGGDADLQEPGPPPVVAGGEVGHRQRPPEAVAQARDQGMMLDLVVGVARPRRRRLAIPGSEAQGRKAACRRPEDPLPLARLGGIEQPSHGREPRRRHPRPLVRPPRLAQGEQHDRRQDMGGEQGRHDEERDLPGRLLRARPGEAEPRRAPAPVLLGGRVRGRGFRRARRGPDGAHERPISGANR